MKKCIQTRAALAVAVASGIASLWGKIAHAQNLPIALTSGSFNYNTVVTAGTPGSSATIVGGNPATVDTENGITFWASSYNSSGALPAAGTPFTSTYNANTQFQMQPYTGNNTLFLNCDTEFSNSSSPPFFVPPYQQTGTLTLATPGAFNTLAVLYTAAGQNYFGSMPPIAYTLNFTDGTSYNNSGSATFTGHSWNDNGATALTAYRIWANPNRNFGQTAGTTWALHEADITVPAADTSKAIASISFYDSGSGYYANSSTWPNDPNSLAIYALSGASSTIIPPMTYRGSDTTHPGSWDTSSLNFINTSAAPPTTIAYQNGANVTFDDTATGPTTVTIPATVSPGSVTFNNSSKSYTLTGAGIAGNGSVTLTGTGTVTFDQANTYIGATNVTAGTLILGTGGSVASPSVIVSSSATLNLSGGALTSTALALTGSGKVLIGSASTLTDYSGTFTGTLTGTGAVTLAGATFQVGSNAAFNLSSGITVGTTATTGTLLINDTADTSAGIVKGAAVTATLLGSGIAGQGALRGADAITTTWAGNVAVASTGATISGGSGGTLNLTGVVSGPSSSTVVFGGNANSTVVLSSSNTYTGPTQVGSANGAASTLKLGVANAISPSSALVLAGSGTLDLNGKSPTFSSLTGTSGSITNSNSTASQLTIPQPAGVSSFGGQINDGAGKVSVAYTGSGNELLNGSSNYSGGTSIPSGTVTTASNSALGTGPVTLAGGKLVLGYSGNGGTLVNGLSLSTFQVNQGYGSHDGPAETITNGTLTLTDVPGSDNINSQVTSAFTLTPQALNLTTGFVAKFTFQAYQDDNPEMADGMAFVLQNDPNGASAIGAGANNLGYAGIQNSVAVALDLYDLNGGPGVALLSGPGQVSGPWTSTSPVVVASGAASPSTFNPNPINFVISYNGSSQTVTETLTDPIAGTTFTTSYPNVNLSSLLGGSTAYVGFTGATGYNNAGQNVSNFSLTNTINGPTFLANNIIATPATSSVIQLSVSAGSEAGSVGSINIGSGALVTLTAFSLDGIATHGVLTTTGLTIAGSINHWTGKLDLTNNSLDVQNGTLSTITNQIKMGYANGTWQGSGGLTSSSAAADTAHLTALGVILNTVDGSTPLYGSGTALGLFSGASPAATDVLVKYTYFGDANLDGSVDGSDYSLIDNGSLNHLSGWYNGDFNYDGVINGSDYTLIDNAFNAQGATLAATVSTAVTTAEIAAATSASAVPEPASLGILGIAAVGILQRRRRRA